MPSLTLLRLLAVLFFSFLSFSASAQQEELLQAEDAFRFSAERDASEEIVLRWQIAEDYYLYRDHLEAQDAISGEQIALRTGPGAVETDDVNFGPSEVYYLEAVAGLGADPPPEVTVTYQGCKQDSICYPPLTVTLDTQSLEVLASTSGFGPAAPPAAAAGARDGGSEGSGSFSLAEEASDGGMIGSLLASGGALWVVASFLFFGCFSPSRPASCPCIRS